MTTKTLVIYGLGALVLIAIVAHVAGAAQSSGPPAVAGEVTSGSQSTEIDTNVLSPTFGLPIHIN